MKYQENFSFFEIQKSVEINNDSNSSLSSSNEGYYFKTHYG